MNKSITKNYIYNLIYQILAMIVPLVTTPYLSRVLGADGIGIYSYTYSITTYFILIGMLGSTLYAQREIAYVQEDVRKRSKIFFEILVLRFITLGIATILFYCIFAIDSEYSIYYKIFILEFIATMIDTGWFFQGMEEFKKIILRNIIIKVTTVVLVFLLIKTPNDLTKYIWIYVLSTFIGSLAIIPYLKKYITKVKISELKIRKHLKPIIILLIPQIATQIYTLLDKVMIGNITNDMSEVGFYEQAQKIIKLLIMILTSLGTIMLPRIANKFANNDKESIKEYIYKSFNFVFCIGIPIIFGVVVVANEFVPIFYGIGYERVKILLRILSVMVLLTGMNNVLGTQFLLPTKRQKEYNIAIIIGTIVNVILNLILIKYFAGVGACVASVISELIIFIVEIICVKNEIEIIKVFKLSMKYLIAGLFMLIICYCVNYFKLSDIWMLSVKICVGIFVYFSVLIIEKDEFILSIIKKINRKIGGIKI